jgi:hypothetical protein
MADNRSVSPPAAHATGGSSLDSNGHPRRAGNNTARRRSSIRHSLSPNGSFVRRRDSTFSEYSNLNHTMEDDDDKLWNPGRLKTSPQEKSMHGTWPLIFALLPALGGLVFEGGNTFLTDVIFLGLAAVFLRWSVIQPWNWYHASQEIIVARGLDTATSVIYDTESDLESPHLGSGALEDLSDEKDKEKQPEKPLGKGPRSSARLRWEADRESAARELRAHEKIALLWCFLFPMLAAYFLHAIRSHLSRDSEGLVCDFNLLIFVIAAEVRPSAHLITMLQNRTLRQQRICANNPYEQQEFKNDQYRELLSKVEELEGRLAMGETVSVVTGEPDQSTKKTIEAMVSRSYRDKVQPEVNSVTRAMRRYEKKLSNIVDQIDIRLDYLDQRNNDAITLAAVAARHDYSRRGLVGWVFEKATDILTLPFRFASVVFMFPFRTASLLMRHKSSKSHKKDRRSHGVRRTLSDRIPTRVSKR